MFRLTNALTLYVPPIIYNQMETKENHTLVFEGDIGPGIQGMALEVFRDGVWHQFLSARLVSMEGEWYRVPSQEFAEEHLRKLEIEPILIKRQYVANLHRAVIGERGNPEEREIHPCTIYGIKENERRSFGQEEIEIYERKLKEGKTGD
ncbi:MAG: hypothetical protein KKH88_00140 [Nanoarchaeota archaeon]|nr:hypothetical protein [Nanoarchaeota archaeon]